MRRPPGSPRQLRNATAVAVCRRLIQAATDREIDIKWVKVKGHSGDEGNDAADQRANWAQNGGARNESQKVDVRKPLHRWRKAPIAPQGARGKYSSKPNEAKKGGRNGE
eukprot:COSAG06_NODE_22854_length_710_cov_1.527005_2_plen_109_part_01